MEFLEDQNKLKSRPFKITSTITTMVNKYDLSLKSNLIFMKDRVDETSLISEKLQFVADLGRTSGWISNRYTVFLKPYGISTQQLNILRVLRSANDWVAMHKVNELLIIKSPNVTRLADKLVTKALVERDRSVKDRRVVFIQVTEEGRKLLARFDIEHEGELSDYMDSFTKEEAIQLTEILKRIRS